MVLFWRSVFLLSFSQSSADGILDWVIEFESWVWTRICSFPLVVSNASPGTAFWISKVFPSVVNVVGDLLMSNCNLTCLPSLRSILPYLTSITAPTEAKKDLPKIKGSLDSLSISCKTKSVGTSTSLVIIGTSSNKLKGLLEVLLARINVMYHKACNERIQASLP